jgi:hypothetical protein
MNYDKRETVFVRIYIATAKGWPGAAPIYVAAGIAGHARRAF